MNIVVAPDKFRGSLTAGEVCAAVAGGVLQARPEAVVQWVPLADGGEGTCDLLTEWSGGARIEMRVQGPLLTPVAAHYGLSKSGDTAFIEMAVASGLALLTAEERNPLLTSTVGTGELIADALSRGVGKIVLGIGGSATVDAGIGMASALGYRFLDSDGEQLKPVGENLIHIRSIDAGGVSPLLRNVAVVTLCDVTNPLSGPDGAAYVYGPQKGGDKPALGLLDAGLRNFKRMANKYLGVSADFPGAGAAGGLGAGAKVFLNASIEKGIDYIVRNAGLEEKIRNADCVITGEGKIDSQTFSGKVVSEVTRLAVASGKPLIAICGRCELAEGDWQSHGVGKLISLVGDGIAPETAMKEASSLITRKIAAEFSTHPLK